MVSNKVQLDVRRALTKEVCYRLQGLFLAHDKLAAFLSTISHDLRVADSTLLPLLVAPSEKLSSDFHEALEVFFS